MSLLRTRISFLGSFLIIVVGDFLMTVDPRANDLYNPSSSCFDRLIADIPRANFTLIERSLSALVETWNF